jgi:hypothetical protein
MEGCGEAAKPVVALSDDAKAWKSPISFRVNLLPPRGPCSSPTSAWRSGGCQVDLEKPAHGGNLKLDLKWKIPRLCAGERGFCCICIGGQYALIELQVIGFHCLG